MVETVISSPNPTCTRRTSARRVNRVTAGGAKPFTRMNRTTATCIAGMRSKATSKIRIHFFQVRVRPREPERFTRAFGVGIFATRLLGRSGRSPYPEHPVRDKTMRPRGAKPLRGPHHDKGGVESVRVIGNRLSKPGVEF